MSFDITSEYADRVTRRLKPFTVTWNNGVLTGDPGLVAQLTAVLDGRWVHPTPGTIRRASITDGLSVAAAAQALWPRCDLSGDVPQLPPAPDGWVD